MDLTESFEKAVTLLKEKSVHDFEIFGVSSDIIRAEAKHGQTDFLTRSCESGMSIRVIKDGAIGFSYGSQASDALIDAAIASACYQFRDTHNSFPHPHEMYPSLEVFDPAVALLSPEDCIRRAVQLEMSAKAADPRVENVRKASFSRSSWQVRILNSHGISSAYSMTSISASLMVTARQDSDVQSGYDFDFSHFLAGFDVEKVAGAAVARAIEMLFARQLKTTKIPVLFDTTSTAQLLDFISQAFLGENVIKGKSFLKDKFEKRCFSECINLSDNPLNTRAADCCPFDGEGVPSQYTSLVKDGAVTGFLYDTYWANHSGMRSTGNSVRGGYRSWPGLGIRHLCLEPSCRPISRSLEDLPVVLKVTDIMGMHTANEITGELSVGINAVLLEEGRPAYPVREAALSGNIYELFSRVIAVGDDPRGFGQVLCPSLMVDSVDISSR